MHAASRQGTLHAELARPTRGRFRCREGLEIDPKGPQEFVAEADRTAKFVVRQTLGTALF